MHGHLLIHRFHDGGRSQAGFRGRTGDCVVRAIAIATGLPYRQVYRGLSARMQHRLVGQRTPRRGTPREAYQPYLESLGWEWVPTMSFGSGTRVHMRADELPAGPIIARVSRHVAAVRDGIVYDTYDPSREGTRAVYGYFRPGPGAHIAPVTAGQLDHCRP